MSAFYCELPCERSPRCNKNLLDNLSPTVGGAGALFSVREGWQLCFKPRSLPQQNIVTLAQLMLLHGVIDDQTPALGDGKGEYSPRFDARSWIYLVFAHLGVGEPEAWGMMMGLRAARAAKYPKDKKGRSRQKRNTETFRGLLSDCWIFHDGVESRWVLEAIGLRHLPKGR